MAAGAVATPETITPDAPPETITPDAPPSDAGFLPTVASDVGGAAKGLLQFAKEFVEHGTNEYDPENPVTKVLAQQWNESMQAKSRMQEAFKKGDTLGVVQHAAGMVPIANNVDSAMSKYQEQPTHENLAHVVTSAIPAFVPEMLRGVGKVVPSASRAGAALEDVKAVAGDVPIKTGKVGDTALELWTQSERGATLPPSVRKLVQRMTKPGSDPMTYEEAKDFQSNISQLSADEKMTLKPNTKRLVGQLNQDMKAALEDAADTQGKGKQFVDAMKEYHNAMRIQGFSDKAIKLAVKAGLAASGIYGGEKLWEMTKSH